MDIRDAFLNVAFMAFFFNLIFFVPLWGPRLVFGWLGSRSSDPRDAPVPSFFLSDGLVLTGFLSVANALVAVTREPRNDWSTELAIFTNLLVVAGWIMCQRFLRRHEIRRQQRRILVQAALYPLSILAVAQIMASILVLLVCMSSLARGIDAYFAEPMVIAASTLLVIAVVAAWAIRQSFRRFVLLDGEARPMPLPAE